VIQQYICISDIYTSEAKHRPLDELVYCSLLDAIIIMKRNVSQTVAQGDQKVCVAPDDYNTESYK
jgi:hypothetical protein